MRRNCKVRSMQDRVADNSTFCQMMSTKMVSCTLSSKGVFTSSLQLQALQILNKTLAACSSKASTQNLAALSPVAIEALHSKSINKRSCSLTRVLKASMQVKKKALLTRSDVSNRDTILQRRSKVKSIKRLTSRALVQLNMSKIRPTFSYRRKIQQLIRQQHVV